MNKTLAVLFAALVTVSVQAQDKPAAHKPDDVVARVGDTAIKWKDVDVAVRAFTRQFSSYGQGFPEEQLPALQYNVVNDIISHEVVVQATRGQAPKDLEETVNKQISGAKAQLGGEEGFARALNEMGITNDEYLKRLRDGITAQAAMKKLVDEKVKVTDEDTKKFYDENSKRFVMPERCRASHILIRLPENASDEMKAAKMTQIKAAQSLLKGGDKFEDVARKFSECPSAAQGGDLDYFTRDRMVREFSEVAFTLKPNEVSDIVTTQFGYHIIKVTDRKDAGQRPYDESKEDIARFLKEQKGRELIQEHIQALRDKAKIEILLPKTAPVSLAPRSGAPAVALPTVETKPVAAPKP